MMASGFMVRVTGVVFVFKSASLVLKQVPTCIRKPKNNTFDKSIKFLHWLFLVFSDGFWQFQMVLCRFSSFLDRFRSFQIVLGHFSLFLTLVSNLFKMSGISNWGPLVTDRNISINFGICMGHVGIDAYKNVL